MKSTSLELESEASSVSICLTEASGHCDFFDLLQTFAKWLWPLQFRHFVPQAGHFSFLNTCSPPQNKHVFRFPFGSRVLSLLGVLTCELHCRILFTSSVSVPEITWSCKLVASVIRHMSMHLLKVICLSWRSLFLSCLLLTPRTILSLIILSCTHEQKLMLPRMHWWIHLPLDLYY